MVPWPWVVPTISHSSPDPDFEVKKNRVLDLLAGIVTFASILASPIDGAIADRHGAAPAMVATGGLSLAGRLSPELPSTSGATSGAMILPAGDMHFQGSVGEVTCRRLP